MVMNRWCVVLVLGSMLAGAGIVHGMGPAIVGTGTVQAVPSPSMVKLEDGTRLALRDPVGFADYRAGDPVRFIGVLEDPVGPSIVGVVLLPPGTRRDTAGRTRSGFDTSAGDDADDDDPDDDDPDDDDGDDDSDDDDGDDDSDDDSDDDTGDDDTGDGDGDGDDEPDDEGVFESTGRVVSLPAAGAFGLDDGLVYLTDGATEFEDGLGSYSDIGIGMVLEVEARTLQNGANLAVEVRLESEFSDGEAEGEVAAVDTTGFSLTTGERFEVTGATSFDGDADRLEDLQIGWFVEVEYFVQGGVLPIADEVDADDPEPATTAGEDFEPNQALVVPVVGADVAAIAARYDAEILASIGETAALFWWDDEIDDELLAEMDADPDVAAVEPNYRFRDPESVRRRYVVIDREGGVQSFLNQSAAEMSGANAAKSVASGRGVVVAVVDTGVDPLHSVLAGRIEPGGLDLVDGDTEPWESRDGLDQDGDGDVDEASGHGTFVASLVGLMAPEARILPYRVLDDDGGGSAYAMSVALADAIERQVDVISLSLVYDRRSAAVDLLLETASGAGILVVASAGNDGSSNLPFPASDRHTVAVTAVAADGGSLAEFANRSQQVCLAAPGVDVYGAVDGDRWGTWSGTSMAAPLVAGAAALMKGLDPTLDPELLRTRLIETGRTLADSPWSGVGLDAGSALWEVALAVNRPRQSAPVTR